MYKGLTTADVAYLFWILSTILHPLSTQLQIMAMSLISMASVVQIRRYSAGTVF